MNISIIIVNYNGFEYTKQCLESIRMMIGVSAAEVIVVDNRSNDRSRTELPGLFPFVKFLWLTENNGFGYANNRGAEAATGTLLLFLNNDTVLTENILPPIIHTFSVVPAIGVVGPKLLNDDGSLQLSTGPFPSIVNEWRTKRSKSLDHSMDVEWVTGAALAIRKDLFHSIGGFDEGYFMYFEDIDLCRRVCDRGLAVRYLEETSLIHFGGKSYDKNNSSIPAEYRRSQLRYYDRHCSVIQRLFVRMYLMLKYSLVWFSPSARSTAVRVLTLIFTRQYEEKGSV